MVCDYCGTSYSVDEFEKLNIDESITEPISLSWDQDVEEFSDDEVVEYVCHSCGGVIVTDKDTSATSCPFCDNPVVMRDHVSGAFRPEYIIPFKLDKEAAKQGLRDHLAGKRLLPKVFTSEHHLDEIKGVYVPFWLFDADVDADMRYSAQRINAWREGNNNVTERSFYTVARDGTISFESIPVDASSKISSTLMESIEPYDFSEVVPFKMSYLSGYYADKYNINEKRAFTRANERIKNSTIQSFEDTVEGYTSVTPSSTNIRLRKGVAHYALYPVWILNTSWDGEKYTFAMNGQTGNFVGDLPVDNAAYYRMALIRTVVVALILLLVFTFVL